MIYSPIKHMRIIKNADEKMPMSSCGDCSQWQKRKRQIMTFRK